MAKANTSRAAVTALCVQFIARSIAQGMKGKTRDRAALEFMLGAATLADCIGDKALYSPLAFLGLMVATRGFEEVKRRAEDQPTADETAAEVAATKGLASSTFDIKTVVAIGGDCYGVGTSITEATRNMKKQNSRATLRAFRFYGCERAALTFECGVDLMILAPAGCGVARLEVRGA